MNKTVKCPYCEASIILPQITGVIQQHTIKIDCKACAQHFICELEYISKKAECLNTGIHKWVDIPNQVGICRCSVCRGMIEKKMIDVYFGK